MKKAIIGMIASGLLILSIAACGPTQNNQTAVNVKIDQSLIDKLSGKDKGTPASTPPSGTPASGTPSSVLPSSTPVSTQVKAWSDADIKASLEGCYYATIQVYPSLGQAVVLEYCGCLQQGLAAKYSSREEARLKTTAIEVQALDQACSSQVLQKYGAGNANQDYDNWYY